MNIRTLFMLAILLLLLPSAAAAQQPAGSPEKQATEVEEVEVPIMTQLGTTQYKGKTIPHVIYPTLPKYAPMQFSNEKEREEYNRLVYNVKKVLPWAKLAKLTITSRRMTILRRCPTSAHVTNISGAWRQD